MRCLLLRRQSQFRLFLNMLILIMFSVMCISLVSIIQESRLEVMEQDGNIEPKLPTRKDFWSGGSEEKRIDTLPVLAVSRGRHDVQQLMRIYDFYHVGDKWDDLVSRYDVCFATQSSVERLYWLPSILEHWTGPLSLAVYITCEEEWLILNLYLNYLSSCHGLRSSQISLHLAVPTNITYDLRALDGAKGHPWMNPEFTQSLSWDKTCPDSKQYLKILLEKLSTRDKEKLRLKEVYPQNHMRNIARKACGAGWTYTTDIDIIPRNGMADMLQEFYNRMKSTNSCEKCAYVIPTFEIEESYPFPKSKLELVELVNQGVAQQFHKEFYSPSQFATDYNRWANTNLDDGPVIISHEILRNSTSRYEPFYIGPGRIPEFDERFVGYGFDRVSQFAETWIDGWNFTVLTPVFSVHWGIATFKTVLSPKKDGVGEPVRHKQVKNNQIIYKKSLDELFFKKRLWNSFGRKAFLRKRRYRG